MQEATFELKVTIRSVPDFPSDEELFEALSELLIQSEVETEGKLIVPMLLGMTQIGPKREVND